MTVGELSERMSWKELRRWNDYFVYINGGGQEEGNADDPDAILKEFGF